MRRRILLCECDPYKCANRLEFGVDNQRRREINILAGHFDGRHGKILKTQQKKLASSFLFGIFLLFAPAKIFVNAEIVVSKGCALLMALEPG